MVLSRQATNKYEFEGSRSTRKTINANLMIDQIIVFNNCSDMVLSRQATNKYEFEGSRSTRKTINANFSDWLKYEALSCTSTFS